MTGVGSCGTFCEFRIGLVLVNSSLVFWGFGFWKEHVFLLGDHHKGCDDY